MARTDQQVADILLQIYEADFAGKSGQRYLISWAEIRELYGFGRLTYSRFNSLTEVAASLRKRLHLLDLGEGEGGHLIAVIRIRTVSRWRRVTKRTLAPFLLESDAETDEDDKED